MFGLPSLQKLLVLVAVIALVWYGFKFISRLQDARKASAKLRESDPSRARCRVGRDGARSAYRGLSPEGQRTAEERLNALICAGPEAIFRRLFALHNSKLAVHSRKLSRRADRAGAPAKRPIRWPSASPSPTRKSVFSA